MKNYYKKRAQEYEEIYYRDDPIRQREQRKIAGALKKVLTGRNVLEVACGTGYWTVYASKSASRITATDAVDEVLKIAKQKEYGCLVEFRIEDAYKLSFSDNTFNGGLANLWFSHVPEEKINAFLEELHRVLKNGSMVFMADNVYIPSIGGKLVRKSKEQNTYKLRQLKDGSEALVLKNYYTVNELLEIFRKYDPSITSKNVFYGKCFWYVIYQLNKIDPSLIAQDDRRRR